MKINKTLLSTLLLSGLLAGPVVSANQEDVLSLEMNKNQKKEQTADELFQLKSVSMQSTEVDVPIGYRCVSNTDSKRLCPPGTHAEFVYQTFEVEACFGVGVLSVCTR
ncbi:hypothetical protein [uncultured Pseudoteredinibacter sp.]|uniref:hypothetical protein n=1 Tax=uncultured Pseudoteredinibacter sp. TaxID=1641701 RepID=UPI002635DDFE|nr:hypothetical protein [uncultured Pseudoteredinibacter sp.]